MIHAQNVAHSALFLSDLASGATASATIDCKGASYATIALNLKTDGNTTDADGMVLALTEGDTTSSFATFDGAFALTALAKGTTPTDVVLHVNRGPSRARFLKISVTTGTNATHDSAVVSATGLLSRLDDRPKSTSDMGTVVVIG